MKHLAHLLSLSLIALGCVSAPPPAPPTQESLRVERLISLWDARDGAGGTEYGPRLSEAFVAAPDDFFLAMSAHPSSFDSWLQALPHSTFTAYIPERLPAITTLLPAMRSTADRFRNHSRYGPMATRLSAALQSVVVREVD